MYVYTYVCVFMCMYVCMCSPVVPASPRVGVYVFVRVCVCHDSISIRVVTHLCVFHRVVEVTALLLCLPRLEWVRMCMYMYVCIHLGV